MTVHPAFRRGVGYGDRFDTEIAAGLRAGRTRDAIAAGIGIGAWFVGCRARILGFGSTAKPPLTRRGDGAACRPVRRANTPSKAVAHILLGRRDESSSRLVRAMRRRLFVLDRDGLDPSHGIACLHVAGLTLPEIEGLTGVSAPVVIAAVRQHCAPINAPRAQR